MAQNTDIRCPGISVLQSLLPPYGPLVREWTCLQHSQYLLIRCDDVCSSVDYQHGDHYLRSFLQYHSADLTLGNVTNNHVLEKGCPQGTVMGPFLWNLIMDDLL
ncbi:hypothetical protein TNCV_400381 [Trichonephila clavipes]|nr:hypothetical protein TNCV_400381 [Trichonephila clavipes]